jgi:hypothetical protein
VVVDVLPVGALLNIISSANCYQNDRKTLENNFVEYTRKIIGVSGKLGQVKAT